MLVRVRQEGWFYKVYYKNKRHVVQYGENNNVSRLRSVIRRLRQAETIKSSESFT